MLVLRLVCVCDEGHRSRRVAYRHLCVWMLCTSVEASTTLSPSAALLFHILGYIKATKNSQCHHLLSCP